jgi:hypothetical protein
VYLDLYEKLYLLKIPTAGEWDPYSYVGKLLEIHNLAATINSCSSEEFRTAAANMDNPLLQRFVSLGRNCTRRGLAFFDATDGEGLFEAMDSCPEVEKNLVEMRRIAEETVALSMGGRGRYRMSR